MLKPSQKIYVDISSIPFAGKGVFARCLIKKGEVIEDCPMIEVQSDNEFIERSNLVSYIYYLGKRKDKAVIVLGFGSFYNHSYTPKAVFLFRPRYASFRFVAAVDIAAGEEITVDYTQGDRGKKAPLWFEI